VTRSTQASQRHFEVAAASVSLGEFDRLDLPALRDLVRFGVMAEDQLARRYADEALGLSRLPQLKESGIVDVWVESLEGARLYSPTRRAFRIVGHSGVSPRKPRRTHASHDVAVVDLADYLVANEPGSRWVAEDELRSFLKQVAPEPLRLWRDIRHRPDGLLVTPEHRIGIELEHTDKYHKRYTDISAWFVREWRIDRVRWYIDNPRVFQHLREVYELHAYDREMHIDLLEFPPGVRLRARPRQFVP
jgi:hypothetical protein